jgi:hypothetical protein
MYLILQMKGGDAIYGIYNYHWHICISRELRLNENFGNDETLISLNILTSHKSSLQNLYGIPFIFKVVSLDNKLYQNIN